MKTTIAAFILFHTCVAQLWSYELPLLGKLSDLGKGWILYNTESISKGIRKEAWTVFTNSVSGDVLSFHETTYGKPYRQAIRGGPWTKMAISTFPGGYSHHNKPAGLNITSVEWGSTNQLVTIANGIKAVSATTYWREEFGTLYLAHSYAFALGDYIVFIQHTLKSIITPEFVKGITDMLIHNYNTNITRKKAQQIE